MGMEKESRKKDKKINKIREFSGKIKLFNLVVIFGLTKPFVDQKSIRIGSNQPKIRC